LHVIAITDRSIFSLFLDICQDVFGSNFDSTYVSKAVKRTLNTTGRSYVYTGSNALITSGSLDPWRSLGVVNVTNTDSVALIQMIGMLWESLIVIHLLYIQELLTQPIFAHRYPATPKR